MMLVDEAIQSRQSIKVFLEETVPRAMIWQCLEMAVWAPNHHMTEPWYFVVVEGSARDRLARAVGDALAASGAGLVPGMPQVQALKERRKIYSAPALVIVFSKAGTSPTATQENYAATAAAMQNFLLMAHSLGLGAVWRTNRVYELLEVRHLLRVPPDAQMVGTLFLGFSRQRAVKRYRTPAEDKTFWLPEQP